jgi:hypothetical protein
LKSIDALLRRIARAQRLVAFRPGTRILLPKVLFVRDALLLHVLDFRDSPELIAETEARWLDIFFQDSAKDVRRSRANLRAPACR